MNCANLIKDLVHQRKLHLEALIKKNDEECYLYVTYDPKQLKNFKNFIYGYCSINIDFFFCNLWIS